MRWMILSGVLGLLGFAATLGGVALLANGHTGSGVALILGSIVYMGLLTVWGRRVDRQVGPERVELLGSARNRALAGAALVAAVMVVAFTYEVLSR